MILEKLKNTSLEELDNIDIDTTFISSDFISISKSFGMATSFDAFIQQIKPSIEAFSTMNDENLAKEFEGQFRFVSIQNPFDNQNSTYVKVNHGFWEMFTYLIVQNTDNLRQRNYSILEAQLRHSGLLPFLMASIKFCVDSSKIHFMQSLTSGIGLSESLFKDQSRNGFDAIRRGVIIGNLINRAFSSQERSDFVDSFPLNYGYQSGDLVKALAGLNSDDSIIVIGPPHLSELSVSESLFSASSPTQFYLAISPTQALQRWREQLTAVKASIRNLAERSNKVVVLFQGAVLGPMVAALIEYENLDGKVLMFDLGRLLDIEVENNTLSHTGSPLPNRSVEPTGVFTTVFSDNMCFQERL